MHLLMHHLRDGRTGEPGLQPWRRRWRWAHRGTRDRVSGAFVASVTLLLAPSAAMASSVLHVPAEYPTIAAAIDAAIDGDVIQLAPGVYPEPFAFESKAVTLRGAPDAPRSTTIAPQAAEKGTLIAIPAALDGDTLTLEGMTIGGFAEFNIQDGLLAMRDCVVTSDANGLSIAFGVTVGSLLLERVTIDDAGYEPHETPLFHVHMGYATLRDCTVNAGSRPILHGIGSEVTVENCSFQNLQLDAAVDPLAAVNSDMGSLAISDSSFASIAPGSAIASRTTDLSVSGCSFVAIGDATFGHDAAIIADGPSIDLVECSIVASGCLAGVASAAILESPATLLDQCIVENNIPSDIGCGGVLASGVTTIRACTFAGNATYGKAGALLLNGIAFIEDSTFVGNNAGDGAGAILVLGELSITRTSFSANVAGDGAYATPIRGGAILVDGGAVTVSDSVFQQNHAGSFGKPSGHGGAIALLNGASAQLTASNVLGNSAMTGGGGIWIGPGAALTLASSELCANQPDQVLGAFDDAGDVLLCGCVGDLDGSGVVDAPDVAVLLGLWGPCSTIAADLNNDGAVNTADLSIVLGAWGGCSPG